MKKYFLLIAAAATVFAVSCRKAREVEQVTTETPQEEIDDTTPQPVRFGSSLNVTVDTKAAVTNFATTDDLYVLGFEKGDNGFKFTEDEPFIPNVKANLATATDAYHPTTYNIDVFNPHGVAGEYFYYVDGKVYDFFGYYLGGAYHAAAVPAVYYTAEEAATYNAALPGALAAIANMTSEQVAAYNALIDPGKQEGDELTLAEATVYNAKLDGAVSTETVKTPAIPATVLVYNNGADVADNGAVTKVAIPVVIDGTNDIMMAKTDHEFDVLNRADDSKYVPDDKMYSAYSARRTVKPNLKFEHQLSRFIFRTKKAGNVPTNHITIKQIALESPTAGNLVLYEANSTATLNFLPTGEASYIPLKAAVDAAAVNYTDVNEYNQLNGTNLSASDYSGLDDTEKIKTPAQVAGYPATGHPGHGEFVQLGESIMVFPDNGTFPTDGKYKFKLSLEQKGISVGIPDMDLTIDLSSLADGKAIPGHQYTVDLLVYGAERVDVTVSLTPWVDAGRVEIDWDKDEQDNRTETSLAGVPADQNMTVGADYTITGVTVQSGETPADLDPQPALSYSSSDLAVATVSAAGVVHAVGAGTATITVKYAGSFTYKPVTATFTVTVTPAP